MNQIIRNNKKQVSITHFYHLKRSLKERGAIDIFYSGKYFPKSLIIYDVKDSMFTIGCFKILQLLIAEIDLKNIPFEYVTLSSGDVVFAAVTIDDDDVVLIENAESEMKISIFEGQHQLKKAIIPLFEKGKLDNQMKFHLQNVIRVIQI